MIKVLQAGFYSTIQDGGRFGYEEYGVPVSGALDQYSAQLANMLLANEEKDAVMEITMSGPQLEFQVSTFICVTGALMQPRLNEVSLKQNRTVACEPGDRLTFGRVVSGFRAYLAVAGGFQTEEVMNSRSMFSPVTSNRTVRKGDLLPIASDVWPRGRQNATVKPIQNFEQQLAIDVAPGPEFGLLTEDQRARLFAKEFTISKNNNRMAYQLEEQFPNALPPIITSLVLPGTVQLTPSGNLILLLRDCQTTGGYPRILQLQDAAMNSLAQKYTGQPIRFKLA